MPTLAPVAGLKDDWDDEVDETQLEQAKVPAAPTAAQIEANRKKAEEAEKALALKMKMAVLANETADERKVRERREVEQADNDLAGELFDTQSTKSGVSTVGDRILADINKYRDTKVKAAKAVAGTKKTKKEIKSSVEKLFGGSDYVDKFEDNYGGVEENYM